MMSLVHLSLVLLIILLKFQILLFIYCNLIQRLEREPDPVIGREKSTDWEYIGRPGTQTESLRKGLDQSRVQIMSQS